MNVMLCSIVANFILIRAWYCPKFYQIWNFSNSVYRSRQNSACRSEPMIGRNHKFDHIFKFNILHSMMAPRSGKETNLKAIAQLQTFRYPTTAKPFLNSTCLMAVPYPQAWPFIHSFHSYICIKRIDKTQPNMIKWWAESRSKAWRTNKKIEIFTPPRL